MPVERRHDDRAGHAAPPVGEKQRARVGDTDQALLTHLEQAELVGGCETVLHGAEQPEGVVPVAAERQHSVDGVLEDARAGQTALLGDVAHEQRRHAALFRGLDENLRGIRGPG